MRDTEKKTRARMPVRSDRGLARRVLSLLLALNLLMSGLTPAFMEDEYASGNAGGEYVEVYSENVDPVVDEADGQANGAGDPAAAELPAFDMADQDVVSLSSVLYALQLPIGVMDVESVALMGSEDEPWELGDPIGVTPEEGDYLLRALRPFTDARLTLYTYGGQSYTLRLIHEWPVAPVYEEETSLPEVYEEVPTEVTVEIPPVQGEPLSDGEQAQPDATLDLAGASSALLSWIVEVTGLPVSLEDIREVGLFDSGLLAVEHVGESDYGIVCFQSFDETGIVLYTAERSFEVRLLNGTAAPETQNDEAPAADGTGFICLSRICIHSICFCNINIIFYTC